MLYKHITMLNAVNAWICPYCKASIRDELAMGPHPLTGKRFCPSCGKQIWTTCECGQSLRFDDEKCSKCGRENPIHYTE